MLFKCFANSPLILEASASVHAADLLPFDIEAAVDEEGVPPVDGVRDSDKWPLSDCFSAGKEEDDLRVEMLVEV